MKKFLLLLMFIPVITFSQVSSWRSTPPQPQRSTPSIQYSTPQRNNMSNWRNSTPNQFNKPQLNRRESNVIIRDPWGWNNWGWNRWNMWGAPGFGWNYWTPMWYYNDWGYRQPARVYIYDDGKRDTVRGKKPIISIGLQHTTDNQLGGFFTVGNKVYFIMDFNSTYEVDRSTFFPNGTIDLVDFPLTNDLTKKRGIYLGLGRRVNRFGVHAMMGFTNERVLWRGEDNIGQITFPKSTHNITSFKFGILRDYKNFTLKTDYDPILKYGQIGFGLNF
jgi:hypothetical protein